VPKPLWRRRDTVCPLLPAAAKTVIENVYKSRFIGMNIFSNWQITSRPPSQGDVAVSAESAARLNAFLVGQTDGFLLVRAPSCLFLEGPRKAGTEGSCKAGTQRVDSVDHPELSGLRILRRSWVQISNKLAEAVNISFT